MRRHSENSGNFIDLEFPCLQELCFVRRDGNRCVFHAFLKDGNLVGVVLAKAFLPGLSYGIRVLDRSGVFQKTSRSCTVCKELGTVLFRCDGKSYGIFRHCDWRISNQSVKAKTGNMQHIGRLEPYRAIFHSRCIGIGYPIFIVEPSFVITVYGHPVRHQRVKCYHFAFAVSDDLCVSVPPKQKMRHKGFPEHKGCHFRIRFIMQ